MSERQIEELLKEVITIEEKHLEQKQEDEEILQALRITFGLEKEEY